MKKPFYTRIWFIVLVSCIGLGVVSFYVVKSQLSGFVEDQIRSQLSNNPRRLYDINFEKIIVRPLEGKIMLKSASIEPRTFIMDSLKQINMHPTTVVHLTVNNIRLEGLDLEKLLWEKVVQVKSIFVAKPEINLDINQPSLLHQNDSALDLRQSLYDLAPLLHNSSINTLFITEGQVLVNHWKHPEEEWATCKDFSFHISDFTFDSSGAKLPLSIAHLSIKIGQITNNTSPFHSISITDIEIDNLDSVLSIGNLSYLPKTSKKDFFKAHKQQKAWLKAETKKITLYGFTMAQIIYDEKLTLKNLSIEAPQLEISTNKSLPRNPKANKEVLSRLIRDIPFPLELEEINLINGQLLYEQENPGVKILGKLPISKFHVKVLRACNTAKYPDMEISVQGKLFDEVTMRGNLLFDMASASDAYTINITLGKGKMSKFNSMLLPMANVNIEEGILNRGKINLRGNKYSMWGTLELDYNDAKIDFVGKEESSKLKNRFISFAANAVIRRSNLSTDPHFQIGLMNLKKPKEVGFVGFIWKTVQEGLMDVLIGKANTAEEVRSVGP